MISPKLTMVGAVLSCLVSEPALTQEVCEDVSQPLGGQRLLRRISLDLRDRVPSRAEIEAQRGATDVEATTVDRFLSSNEFLDVMERYHASLLWPNIDEIELLPETHILIPIPLTEGNPPVYASPLRSVFVRVVGSGALYYPCKDEPAEHDAEGNLIFEPVMQGNELVAYQEGWVEVAPYWAPDTTVRVCALDARANDRGVACPGPADRYPTLETFCAGFEQIDPLVEGRGFRGSMVDCTSRFALLAPECGCGPGLQNCQTPEVLATVRQSLLDQELRIVTTALAENRPYSDVLLMKSVEFNGPIAHFMRFQSRLSFDTQGDFDPTAPAPDLAYPQIDTWRRVERTVRHAGVLTTPGYLLRHQSDRQRAHRFYNAFECSSFIPNGPLPPPSDPCSQHEDLTQRCGCDACHIRLEPMAAHWGRFTEYGFQPLDETDYPTNGTASRCAPPVADHETFLTCLRQYELDPVGEEQAYAGLLNAYVFRTVEERQNIEQGPAKLVQESIDAGRFSSCTVHRMWEHFMRREPTRDKVAAVLPELITSLEESHYDLKSLVKTIVLHPAYGRQP